MAEVTACTCGKVRYLTKADAKAAIRHMKGREGRLNAYRCASGFWHIGHLPALVRKGQIARSEIWPRRRRA